jgi:two-component system sensor histidine kinase/response regulator
MMPDMDGIEVCQRLQADGGSTRGIPVIFITARSSKEGKLEGLGVGAVDYITKPIDLDETLARVQTQLRFVGGQSRADRPAPAASSRGPPRRHHRRRHPGHRPQSQQPPRRRHRLRRSDQGLPRQTRAGEEERPARRGRGAAHRHHHQAAQHGLVVKIAPPSHQGASVATHCSRAASRRFHQIDYKTRPALSPSSNALGDRPDRHQLRNFEEVLAKSPHQRLGGYDDEPCPTPRPLSIQARAVVERPEEGISVEIKCIEDRGRGIDPEMRDKMFEPFVSTKNTVGVGMGLTVARHALRNLGGEVTMTRSPRAAAPSAPSATRSMRKNKGLPWSPGIPP